MGRMVGVNRRAGQDAETAVAPGRAWSRRVLVCSLLQTSGR